MESPAEELLRSHVTGLFIVVSDRMEPPTPDQMQRILGRPQSRFPLMTKSTTNPAAVWFRIDFPLPPRLRTI